MWQTDLYEAIEARLASPEAAAVLSQDSLTPVRCVAPYFGQYLEEEEHPPFECPAVFVDVEAVDWANAGCGSQQGAADIALHLVLHTLASTARPAGGPSAAARMLHAWPARLHQILADLEGPSFGKLMRVRQESMAKDKSRYAIIIRYRCSVRDNLPNRLASAAHGRPDSYAILKSVQ
jgi:hypothetical protein